MLCLRQTVLLGVALEFNIETIGVNPFHLRQQRLSLPTLTCPQKTPNRTIRSTRQTNQPFGISFKVRDLDLRQPPTSVHIENAVQFHQVFIPAL